MTFPFSEISDEELKALHPYNYTLSGNPEMVYYNGVWYPTGDEATGDEANDADDATGPLNYVDPWQDEVYDMLLIE
jgi:hypothetical protein